MTRRTLTLLTALSITAGCIGPVPESDADEVILIEDDPTPDASDAGSEPDVFNEPDVSEDAEPDVVEEDMGEPPPERVTLTLEIAGEGEAVVEVLRDGRVVETCTQDCVVEGDSAGGLPFEVRVLETPRGGALEGFTGPCVESSRLECTVAGDRDVTLRVNTRDYAEPGGAAFLLSRAGEGAASALAVDADGHAHVVVREVASRLVPDASSRGTYYLEMTSAQEVLRAVELPGSSHVLRLHPATGEPWFFGACDRNEDVGAFRMTERGACAWRVDAAGAIVGGAGWPGAVFEDASIGADGTIAILGYVSEDTTVGGHLVEAYSDENTQFVARLDPATLELPWARRITRHRWDLPSGVAVGPQGDVFVLGSLLGERTLFGLTFDTANFLTQAYLVKLDPAGEVAKVRQLEGTAGSFADDITFSGERLYVSLDYGGFLEAGNSSSEESRGVARIGVLLAYDQDLALERFKYLDAYVNADGLSPAPDEGVYVRSSSTSRATWDLGNAGHVVMRSRDTSATALSLVTSQMRLEWTSAIARGYAVIAGHGDHVVVTGVYRGDLLMGSGPTTPTADSTAFMMWLTP